MRTCRKFADTGFGDLLAAADVACNDDLLLQAYVSFSWVNIESMYQEICLTPDKS